VLDGAVCAPAGVGLGGWAASCLLPVPVVGCWLCVVVVVVYSFVVVVVGLWCMLSADAKVNIASLVTKRLRLLHSIYKHHSSYTSGAALSAAPS
jgi:hypothetical protein